MTPRFEVRVAITKKSNIEPLTFCLFAILANLGFTRLLKSVAEFFALVVRKLPLGEVGVLPEAKSVEGAVRGRAVFDKTGAASTAIQAESPDRLNRVGNGGAAFHMCLLHAGVSSSTVMVQAMAGTPKCSCA